MTLCLSQPTALGRAQMSSTWSVPAKSTWCCRWGEQEGGLCFSPGLVLLGIWRKILFSWFSCATIKITLGHMWLYEVFIDHAPSTQRWFGFWLTPDLHQYFWSHKNFFHWQKWLSQPFCFPLLLHPITKAWLLILLSHHSLSRAGPNVYLATQWTRSGSWWGLKNKKTKPAGLFFTQISSPVSSQCSTQT